VRVISPNILNLAWHPHCCPVCNQTWSHTRPRCAEPEGSLCNSCLVYPAPALADLNVVELRARIDSLECVAEAALVLRHLFCDSRHHELRALATFLDKAVDPALCNLEAALSVAGYEDDGTFAK
jgi:hypothetical protein